MKNTLLLLLVAAATYTLPVAAQQPPNPAPPNPAPPNPAPPNPAPETPAEASPAATAEEAATPLPPWQAALKWRSIGPASMGGRVVDLEVVPSNPYTFYVATGSGGIFKTTNNGTTFAPIFQKQQTVSIGDMAVSKSDPNILWVGTGEHNARNSVSWGNGVYRSLDSGRTWQHRGLDKSFQIGRIAIHPTNPDIVYVGVLGRLWGPSVERGVYRTLDGGETWVQVLYVDDKTGCIELQMHPRDPNTLLCAMYERQRDAFDTNDPAKRWGPGSGLYKTTDGGDTWNRVTKGLPTVALGRIGISYYDADPNVVYAIVESEKIGDGPEVAYMGIQSSRDGTPTLQVIDGGPAAQAGLKTGDIVLSIDEKPIENYDAMIAILRSHKPGEKSPIRVRRGDEELDLEITWGKREGNNRPFSAYLGGQRENIMEQQGEIGPETGGIYRSADGGESWVRINSLNPRPFYYSQIRIDPSDERHQFVLGVNLHYSSDGGKQYRRGGSQVHADHHAMWIDPRDGRHIIHGCDGGLYISYDRGATWDFHNLMAIAQFYHVAVDTRSPYWVYGGLQDNGSWGAPSRMRGRSGPRNDDWLRIGGGDGFVCQVDPNDPDLIYYESQNGATARLNRRTGERASLRPRPPRGTQYRFNWKTPFTLSHHNSRIYYSAGNFVFKSLDRGSGQRPISPEITRTSRGSATALAESPRDPDVLYVGTDDGYLWVTRDGGRNWENVTQQLKLPGHFAIATIEASRFEAGRAYIAVDGHRSDNDDPHLFVTEDAGKTWQAINNGLPTGSTRVVREDAVNANLLYCGTEFGVFVSIDRGATWESLKNNLPTVAVHEIAVHPTQNEIVAATHGRSLWVMDVTPLRQLNSELAQRPAHLFSPSNAVLWGGRLNPSTSGHQNYSGENAEFGAALYYWLGSEAKDARLEIVDIRGDVVRQLPVADKPGLHRVLWDLRRRRNNDRQDQQFFARLDRNRDQSITVADAEGPLAGTVRQVLQRGDRDGDRSVSLDELRRLRQSQQRGGAPGPPVEAGTYLVRLTVGDKVMSEAITVEADPEVPDAMLTEELELFEESEERVEVH